MAVPSLQVQQVPQSYPVPVIVQKPVPYQVRIPNLVVTNKLSTCVSLHFTHVNFVFQVEKQVFTKVEKKVPTPIEKIVPVKVEKPVPFTVVKHIPVPVAKPIPIKIPVYKTIVHSHKGH